MPFQVAVGFLNAPVVAVVGVGDGVTGGHAILGVVGEAKRTQSIVRKIASGVVSIAADVVVRVDAKIEKAILEGQIRTGLLERRQRALTEQIPISVVPKAKSPTE